ARERKRPILLCVASRSCWVNAFANKAALFRPLLATASWRSLGGLWRLRMRLYGLAGQPLQFCNISKKPDLSLTPSTAYGPRCALGLTPAQPWWARGTTRLEL